MKITRDRLIRQMMRKTVILIKKKLLINSKNKENKKKKVKIKDKIQFLRSSCKNKLKRNLNLKETSI